MKSSAKLSSGLCALLAGAGLGLVAASAQAQQTTTLEELTVTGRLGKVPENVQSITHPVSFADLDLSTDAGKREFHRRLELTARFLCEKLGEPTITSSVVPSCRDAAIRDAMAETRKIEARFVPRLPSWTPAPAWTPPYPAEWTAK